MKLTKKQTYIRTILQSLDVTRRYDKLAKYRQTSFSFRFIFFISNF